MVSDAIFITMIPHPQNCSPLLPFNEQKRLKNTGIVNTNNSGTGSNVIETASGLPVQFHKPSDVKHKLSSNYVRACAVYLNDGNRSFVRPFGGG